MTVKLSWPVNFRWLYVEGLFMTQSKSAPAGEQAGTKHTAPAKNIVDTAIGAGNFTSGPRGSANQGTQS
jgi:hypothetical protein